MNDRLQRFYQMNCGLIPNATSSLELEDGHSPLPLLDGQKTAPSGLDHVHASLSVLPEDKKVKGMIAIYGRSGSASLRSAVLQRSLESKLVQQLPMGGLTMFIKGWNRKVTPLGRLYFQLAALARPISAIDCGLWVTPQSFDATNDGKPRTLRYKGNAPSEAGNTRNPNKSGSYRGDLKDWVGMVTMWTKPSSRDWKDSRA